MKIQSLIFSNIRNHKTTELHFSKHINVFYGLNGTGKTSILEAISIAALSKSFINTPENSIINFEEDSLYSKVKSIRDRDTEFTIEVKKERGNRKKISSSFMETMRPKDLIGNIPIIILSPDYKEITAGSPENRRRFINTTISQISNNYLNDLYSYNRILKQRNNLLSKMKKDRTIDSKELEVWTSKLIEFGAKIILRRAKFINDFEPYYLNNYARISDKKEKVEIKYTPYGFDDLNYKNIDENTILKRLIELKDTKKIGELKRFTTLFGPQKDEIDLKINGFSVRETASQGQHKSVLIGLKLAEFDYMKEVLNETPIVLLDDIFSELDAKRSELVIKTVMKNLAQAFITITEDEKIRRILSPSDDCYYFYTSEGKVRLTEEG